MNNEIGGHPVQIVDFCTNNQDGEENSSTMHLVPVDLSNICKAGGDKPVILISIAGPSRKGKSFFLSFIIRYLQSIGANSDCSSDSDWIGINKESQPLRGFQWGNGYEIQTTGIWLWSRPFFIKNNEGRECAVIIMDTQGVFDEETDETDWCRIIGLSLLLSSVTILNMSELLEDSLKQLNVFIDYGVLVNEKQEPGILKPFRKLLFLLRDWNNPDEFPYGEDGGQKFLNKKLEIETKKKMSPPSKRVREKIRECFQDLDCFLLPPPGEMAKSKTFDGTINKLEQTFSLKITECIEANFAPEKLKILKIGGVEVKCRNLLDYFSKFVEILNKEKTPSSQSLYDVTVQITNTNLVDTLFEEYKEKICSLEQNDYGFIPHNQIEEIQLNLLAQQLHLYNSEKKHGNEKIWTEFSSKLEKKICKEYRSVLTGNKILLKDAIKRETVNICEQYKESLLNKIETESFLEQEEFGNCSKENMSFCVGIYKSIFESEDSKLFKKYEEKLSSKLTEAEVQMDLRNQVAKTSVIDFNKSIIKNYFQKYSDFLSQTLSENTHLTNVELENVHSEFITKYSERVLTKLRGKQSFISKFEQHLKKKWETKYQEIQHINSIKQTDTKSTLEEILSHSLKTFKEKLETLVFDSRRPLSTYLDSIQSIEHELKENLDEILDEKFNERLYLFTENLDAYTKKLIRIKKKKLNELERQIQEKRIKVELELKTQTSCFQQILDKKLDTFSNTYFTEEEFINFSKETLEVIADKFECFSASLLNDEECQHYVEELYSTMYEMEKQAKEQLNSRTDEATSLANGHATEAKAYYQEKLLPYVSEQLSKDVEEFRNVHLMLLGDAKAKFLSNGYKYNQFTNKFLEQIENESENVYEHCLELYKMNLNEKIFILKKLVQSAQLYYSQEMQKHMQGDEFLEPSVLRKYHEIAVANSLKQMEQGINKENTDEILKSLEKLFVIYKDKNNLLTPVQINNIAIGIDLGTTYTCVAIYLNGEVTIIPYKGNPTTPSCVAFDDNGERLFGENAKKFKKLDQSICDVKRMIGLQFTDESIQKNLKNWNFVVENVDNSPVIKVLGNHYPPEKISGLLLEELKFSAEEFLKNKLKMEIKIQKAVIAVPANFTDGQLQATKDAATIAGLNVLRMPPEPTLAAVSYRNLQMRLEKFEKFVLVFDLGGGTFDVAVLHVSGNEVICKAKCGDSQLGGQDFDQNMVTYCLSSYHEKTGIDILERLNSKDVNIKDEAKRAIHMIRGSCEKSKQLLSTSQNVEISLYVLREQIDLNVPMSRTKFEELNQHLFDKTIHLVEKVLLEAAVEKDQIEDIVLVGGSTRIPKIQEMVSNFFNGKALSNTVHKDEAVAHGAAIIAAVCTGEIAQESGNYVQFTNVTPRSFGISRSNGDFSIIIPKGTTIPCAVMKQKYKTSVNNQTRFEINVYEGECPKAADNHFLGKFIVDGIPPKEATKEEIYLTMLVDSNGILHVTAKSKRKNSQYKELVITENKCRLNKEAIEKLQSEGLQIPSTNGYGTSPKVRNKQNKSKIFGRW